MKIRIFAGILSMALAAAGGLRGQGYVETFKPSPNDSVEARQARTATRLSRRMVGGEAELLRSFAGLYQEVWRNTEGLTPQQVCDALGSKAGSLFIIAGTMANALYGIDPAGLGSMVSVPPGYSVTVHPDGTVSVSFSAPSPTPSPSPMP